MQTDQRLREVLAACRQGTITLEEAAQRIEGLRIEAIGEMARFDADRTARCGIPEVVLGEGKSPDQVARIARGCLDACGRCIISRLSPGQFEAIAPLGEEPGTSLAVHREARMAVLSRGAPPLQGGGVVAVITAGTSDIGVAEEARIIAGEMGCQVRTAYDVGAAGIHRLFPALKECLDAHVFVVAAGREGTLPAVVAGLVDRPVIGVPVSTGYG